MQRRALLTGLLATLTVARSAGASGGHGLLAQPGRRPRSLDTAAGGERLVVVVMKSAHCSICLGELGALRMLQRELGATRVVGLTHNGLGMAQHAQRTIGWPVLSEPGAETIVGLGLWLREHGFPQPAVLVYDRCGREIGRIVGRVPGQRATDEVFELLEQARDDVCPAESPS